MPHLALVVEDSRDFARLVTDRLARAGHETAVARNQDQAYQLLKLCKFDCVLLDLALPQDEDDADPSMQVGFDVLSHIVDPLSAPLPPPPVWVMTAYGDGAPTAVRAMEMGAQSFLEKPHGRGGFRKFARELENVMKAVHARRHRSARQDEHYLTFDRSYVYVDQVKFHGQIARILSLLAVKGCGGLGLDPEVRRAAEGILTYRDMAARLGCSDDAVRATISRFRARYRKEMRRRGRTVDDNEIIASSRGRDEGCSLGPRVVICQFPGGITE